MHRRIRLLVIPFIICGLLAAGFTWKLPGIEVPRSSIIYDSNGRIIKGYTCKTVSRSTWRNLALHCEAFISVEDKNFYRHRGIDAVAIMQAALVNLGTPGGGRRQYHNPATAKNLFLTQERTLTRKIKELYYTFLLEEKYTKDEILSMYLNTIYFGRCLWGRNGCSHLFW